MKTGVEGFVLFTDGTTVGIDFWIEHDFVDSINTKFNRIVDIFTKNNEHYRYVCAVTGEEKYYLVERNPIVFGLMNERMITVEYIESFMLIDRKGEKR